MATLPTGEEVAVKIQRPEIDRLVREDIAVMAWLAPLLARRIDILKIVNLPAVIELFAETIVEELDFRLEAENMLDVAMVLDRAGQGSIVVPRPHPTLVTPRVLVMERMYGFAFTDVTGMREANVDTAAVVRACLVSVLEGAMIYGVFHGDLHGGNLLIRPDGRVALLDYGITGRLDDRRRTVFLRMLLAAMTGDHRAVLVGYQDLGAISPDADLDEFMREIPMDRPGRRRRQRQRRSDDRRDAPCHEGAGQARNPAAQGADAVHEGLHVHRRRHRDAGARPRRLGRDALRQPVLRPPTRRPDRLGDRAGSRCPGARSVLVGLVHGGRRRAAEPDPRRDPAATARGADDDGRAPSPVVTVTVTVGASGFMARDQARITLAGSYGF